MEVWKCLKDKLLEQQVDFREFITKGPLHATKIAAQITSSASFIRIVVLGGDGTLHEVLSGIQNMKYVRLGYIPIGSSNDFARGMKWRAGSEERLDQILAEMDTYEIDYGSVKAGGIQGRFAVSAGIGYDAAVCEMANRSKGKKVLNSLNLGKLIYVQIGLRSLWKANLFSAQLVLDDSQELFFEQVLFVSVHNLPYEGGGIPFCPKADAKDGWLDVCIVAGIAKRKMPPLLLKARKGTHTESEGVHIYRCKKMKIKLEVPQYLHMDGEVSGKVTEAEVTVSDDKVKMI